LWEIFQIMFWNLLFLNKKGKHIKKPFHKFGSWLIFFENLTKKLYLLGNAYLAPMFAKVMLMQCIKFNQCLFCHCTIFWIGLWGLSGLNNVVSMFKIRPRDISIFNVLLKNISPLNILFLVDIQKLRLGTHVCQSLPMTDKHPNHHNYQCWKKSETPSLFLLFTFRVDQCLSKLTDVCQSWPMFVKVDRCLSKFNNVYQ